MTQVLAAARVQQTVVTDILENLSFSPAEYEQAVQNLREVSAQKQQQEKAIDYLTAPVITWPNSDLPPELVKKAKLSRLTKLLKNGCKLDGQCTDFEAAIYVMTCSFVAPLDDSWTRIYGHLFRKEFPQYKDVVDGMQEPDEWQLNQLPRLKEWIFKKQMEAAKHRRL